jgi:hypothetical protein
VFVFGRKYSGLRPKCRCNLVQTAIGLREAVVDSKKQDDDCDEPDNRGKFERHEPII